MEKGPVPAFQGGPGRTKMKMVYLGLHVGIWVGGLDGCPPAWPAAVRGVLEMPLGGAVRE